MKESNALERGWPASFDLYRERVNESFEGQLWKIDVTFARETLDDLV